MGQIVKILRERILPSGGGGGIGAPVFVGSSVMAFGFGPPALLQEMPPTPGATTPSFVIPPGPPAYPTPILRVPMYSTFAFSWISARVLPVSGSPTLNAPLTLTVLKNGVGTLLTLVYPPLGSGFLSLTGTPVVFSPGDALTFRADATGATTGGSQFSVLVG